MNTTMEGTTMPMDPDPRFADHLEWQLRTALRRADQFAEPVASAGSSRARIAKIAIAFVAATAIGACGVLAAQEIRRSSAADLLGAQYRVRVEIARLRIATAQEELDAAKLASAQGAVPASELEAAQLRTLEAEMEARAIELDAFEVSETGREPDRRISAPVVAGRDL